MKKSGVLNAPLSKLIATMGHSDKLVICDSGLPIPNNAEIIDLAVTNVIPKLIDVLKIILEELYIEEAIIAKELQKSKNEVYKDISSLMNGIKISSIKHEEFKDLYRNEKYVSFVRTGENTPFANIILVSGVEF